MFQEGHNREVEHVFRDITRLTRGAYCRFDPGAARQLAELLRAVAVYAVAEWWRSKAGPTPVPLSCSDSSGE
jgi:hypothetical protein